MKVLILSKTHIGNSACIGGIMIDTFQYVRLMAGTKPRLYQPSNTSFNVGNIWDIEFDESPDIPPHIEDVIVREKKYVSSIDVRQFVVEHNKKGNITIWKGKPNTLFDGCLEFLDNNIAYIGTTNISNHSIGFWILNKELGLSTTNYLGKIKYRYLNDEVDMSYVGFEDPIETIPTGTLLRVSLAKWFTPTNRPHGCYLQLSGWY